MATDSYIHIGKIVAPFGVSGQLILQHVLGKKSQLPNITVLFIEEVKGSYLPYFLIKAQAKTHNESILQLETIVTREAAQRLCTRPVWLLETDFRKLAGKTAPISLLGYMVVQGNEKLGVVQEVIEQPHQVLLTILWQEKEAYIPLHAETLQAVDHARREVHVALPEGLLDIYR
jgi:16S rRNA processing protein RimM